MITIIVTSPVAVGAAPRMEFAARRSTTRRLPLESVVMTAGAIGAAVVC